MTYTRPIAAVAAPSPSVIGRNALREALRTHAEGARVLDGRSASTLRIDELRDGLKQLGLDPDAVIRDAIGRDAGVATARACVATARAYQAARGTPTPALDLEPVASVQSTEDSMNTDDTAVSEEDTAAIEDAAIEAEVSSFRRLVVDGGFTALDTKLRDLVREARKPAVVIMPDAPAAGLEQTGAHAPAVPQASPTRNTVAWSKAFGVRSALGKNVSHLWDGKHPETPIIDPRYQWPDETAIALTQLARGENVMLYGPAGCGKTEFVQQLAARLGRPFALISCDASTDAATLVGMTVPSIDGSVTFQPGQLTRAISTPGCVICIDEPSIARPGALFALQNVLTRNRALYIQETGQRVKVAPGVIFFATDNTAGHGGGARRGFHGTGALNAATLDRFGVRIELGWHAPDIETRILCAAVPGCTPPLAELLITAANITRAAAADQSLTAGIGLRRLFAWAALLIDGIDVEAAFKAAILNCTPEAEQEALRQQCILAIDRGAVRTALAPPGTPAPSAASLDFDTVDNMNAGA